MRMFHLPAPLFRHAARLGLACLFVACAAGKAKAEGDTNAAIADVKKSFEDLRKQFHGDSQNTEAAWKFARACFDLSSLQTDPSQQATISQQGIDACRQSLVVKSNSVQAHYYLGMNIGQLADTKRNLAALRMVKDMEREFFAALNLDERFDYAGPDRNLGLLYREAPIIASVGSRSKARQHLQKAVELAPDFPENRLNLIESYLKWGSRADAARELGELEKIWPDAQKNLSGEQWVLSWVDWDKRLSAVQKKLETPPKSAGTPHSAS